MSAGPRSGDALRLHFMNRLPLLLGNCPQNLNEDNSTYLALVKATICEALGFNDAPDEAEFLERKIEALNKKMLSMINESVQECGDFEGHEAEFKEIAQTIDQLRSRIKTIRHQISKDDALQERINQIQQVIDELQSKKYQYDESVVRQMVECVKVYSGGKLEIVFDGGYTVEEELL